MKELIAKVYKNGDDKIGIKVEGCTINDHLNIIAAFISATIERMFDAGVDAETSVELLELCVRQGVEVGLANIKSKFGIKAKNQKELEEEIINIVREAMKD